MSMLETSIIGRQVADAENRHIRILMKSGSLVYLCPEDLLEVIRYAVDQRLITLDQVPQGTPIELAIDKLSALLQKPIRHYEGDEQVLLQTARARLMEVRDLLIIEAERRAALAQWEPGRIDCARRVEGRDLVRGHP